MLRRKIEKTLVEWKSQRDKKPLILRGLRQCGKTYIVRDFAKKNYTYSAYINFALEPDKCKAFEGDKSVDTIIMNLSAMIPGAVFVNGKTCIILDEIQECMAARTALKAFCEDGRFDVIATGSLLGVKGYNSKGAANSIPVGYETIIDMYPLDFEEFLWANEVDSKIIDLLRNCLNEEKPVPEAIHAVMMSLLHRYVVTGGLPAVVDTFVKTKDIGQVYNLQRTILDEYKDDMVKYADPKDRACIRECFESIPKQLAKENKKFQYSVVRKGGRASQFLGSLQWLEDASVIKRCYNTSTPELPLDGNAIEDVFKVYTTDIGLFVAMLDFGTQADILQGNLYGYKGAIFENLMADFLSKLGRKLYYYHKDSGLEIDFLLRHESECILLEIKANTGKGKSISTVLKHPEIYHIRSAVKLGNYNVGRDGQILTLPMYMGFLLKEDSSKLIANDIDIASINSLV